MKHSLRSWLWRVPLDQEIDEELSLHIELRTRELIERGMDPQAARDLVLSRIGDLGQLKRTCIDLGRKRDREMCLTQWLDEVGQDVRLAIRQLNASPGFAIVAVATLALGIGANSAMFALADAALLRPLPFPEPDRLVLIEERSLNHQGSLRSRIAPLNVHDWSTRNRTFQMMAAVYVPPGGGGPALTGTDGVPEIVPNQNVSARFFDVLGVRPLLGRTFLLADETADAAVVVLSEALWRTRFGGDPSIVGRAFLFDGEQRTVVGVVPSRVQFLRPSSMWTLLRTSRDDARGRRVFAGLRVIGRLAPGISMEMARSDLNVIADGLARQYGDTREGRRVTVEPFRQELIGGELRLTSLLFLAVVGCVLLLCCANLANLLLARATARSRELAVRSALGAGRLRIIRQLVTESLVLATCGGALGAGVGAAILSIAPSMLPAGLLPAAVALTFDARVLAFCAIASMIAGVAFGLAPAWHATGGTLMRAMTSDTRAATRHGHRFRTMLAAGQIAAAVLVLCGAGLLVRTLMTLDSFAPGYNAASDAILTMDITQTRGAGGALRRTSDAQLAFYDAIERELSMVPGIREVAWATTLPLGNSQTGAQDFYIVGAPPVRETDRPRANYQIVSPSYFSTLDLPLVAGRAFDDTDTTVSTPVCIVSEAFVRRYLQGRSAIGTRIVVDLFAGPGEVEREIVGVARQIKGRADETEDLAQIYVPNDQDIWAEAYLLVRASAGSAESLMSPIRAAIARVDKDLPVRSVLTLDGVARQATERYRFRAVLAGTFGVLALVLAMAGIFGVLAYSVQQRTREFGVRVALGATAGSVLRMVFAGAARVVGVGALIGLALAALLTQTMTTFLFGVTALDPATFAGVLFLLAVTAALASAVPAIRASRVDPVEAFRAE